jgi:hypothetical protein
MLFIFFSYSLENQPEDELLLMSDTVGGARAIRIPRSLSLSILSLSLSLVNPPAELFHFKVIHFTTARGLIVTSLSWHLSTTFP